MKTTLLNQSGQVSSFLQQQYHDFWKTSLFWGMMTGKNPSFIEEWIKTMHKILARDPYDEIDVDEYTQKYIIEWIVELNIFRKTIVKDGSVIYEKIIESGAVHEDAVILNGNGPGINAAYPWFLFESYKLSKTYYVEDYSEYGEPEFVLERFAMKKPVTTLEKYRKLKYGENLPCHYMVHMVCILIELIRSLGKIPQINNRRIVERSIINGGIRLSVGSLCIYNYIFITLNNGEFSKRADVRHSFVMNRNREFLPYGHMFLQLKLEGLAEPIIFDPSNKQFMIIDTQITQQSKREKAIEFLIPLKTSIVPVERKSFYVLPGDEDAHEDIKVIPEVPVRIIKHTNDLLASIIVGKNMLDKKLLQSILASHLD
jgi:hypothetical protein